MKTRLSICKRKARYASATDALAAVAQSGLVLRAYRCDRCGQVHLTSRTKGKRVPRAEREGELARDQDQKKADVLPPIE